MRGERTRNVPFIVSVALHAAVAIAALVAAARAHRGDPPAEDVVWIEMAPPPDRAPPERVSPPRPVEAPKVVVPVRAAAPVSPARATSVRPAEAGSKSGGPSGGGLGVLAGDGPGDGFEVNPEAGDGTGNGGGGGPAAAAPPEAPPPPKAPPPKPRQPSCDEAVTKPKPVAKPRSIDYPEAARADGKEGRLLLELSVAEDGSVGAVTVVAGVHPALDAAAIVAVKTWRFEPASRCGKPATGTYRVARRFELGD